MENFNLMAYEILKTWFMLWSIYYNNILSAFSLLQYVLQLRPEKGSLFPHLINLGWPCDLLSIINRKQQKLCVVQCHIYTWQAWKTLLSLSDPYLWAEPTEG